MVWASDGPHSPLLLLSPHKKDDLWVVKITVARAGLCMGHDKAISQLIVLTQLALRWYWYSVGPDKVYHWYKPELILSYATYQPHFPSVVEEVGLGF